MIILGIDPGTANTGYGVIKTIGGKKTKKLCRYIKCGLIKTTPDLPTGERLKILNNELSKVLKKYQPKVLALESLFFFKNLKTALPVSQASGVILLTAAKNKVPVCNFTPLQVKMTIAGHGWAEKEKVHKKLIKMLDLKEIPKPDDAADALAIALTYVLKTSS
ncbi:crossover junction endodeoxyribonuclease RuvC [Patescibacteria group bacterium]